MNDSKTMYQIYNDEYSLVSYPYGVDSSSFTVDDTRKDITYGLYLRIPIGKSVATPTFKEAELFTISKFNDESIEFVTASDESGSFSASSVYVIIPCYSRVDGRGNTIIKYDIVADTPTNALGINLLSTESVETTIAGMNTANVASGTKAELSERLGYSYDIVNGTNFNSRPRIASVLTAVSAEPSDENYVNPSSGYKIGTTYTIYPLEGYWDDINESNIVKPTITVNYNISLDAEMKTTSFTITGGSGYQAGDTFSVSNGGSIEVASVDNQGAIRDIVMVTQGSSFTSAPTVTYDSPSRSVVGSGATVTVNNSYAVDSVSLDSSDGFPFTEGGVGTIRPLSGYDADSDLIDYTLYYETDNPGVYAVENLDKFSLDSIYVMSQGIGYGAVTSYDLHIYKPNYVTRLYEYVANTFDITYDLKLKADNYLLPSIGSSTPDASRFYDAPLLSGSPPNNRIFTHTIKEEE